MSEGWTIAELAARAAAALADLDVNGRVQDVPNERLIRWYTTLGLLDPPVRHGRHARYTPRHLLQLVAVKRRQATGLSLAEIQAELVSAPDGRLTAITGPLPEVDIAWSAPRPSPRRFWAAEPPAPDERPEPERSEARSTRAGSAPSPEPPPAAVSARGPLPAVADAAAGTESAPVDVVFAVQGVRLAPGVTLLLEGGPVGGEDAAALLRAASPLLAELAHRGLLPGEGEPAART
ncbi:helix-turn-helix domain-containing protein [Actinocorallia sp. API 0066]|uniref:helix-turn-helix domain-containing protein n=1 Tax=Actinocorallia sp. API 0066 TaxID=2896846 RepID=UPI001E2D97BF|nr:helix-turn-helix domain-containing protein [Actinocorallia sp. API 0066]MCD0452305.1 helix-turn-helix domain-containing protein [Actinocorallia sp. API 0066]